jgi:adhesin transport system outer membrane protein
MACAFLKQAKKIKESTMKAKFLLLVLMFLTPMVLVSVTLEDAVKEVLSTNPVVQERIKYYRSVQQDVGVAESGYYPKLDFVAAYGREKSNNSNTLYTDRYLDREEVGIVFTQNIFEGFGTQHDVKKQSYRVDSAAFGVIEQANKVSLNMIEAYTNLFKQKELLALSEANVETHKRINGKIQDRINSGVGANSELEQSNGRLALAQSNYVVQLNNYEDTVSNFIKIYGQYISPEDLVEPTGVDMLPDSKDELLLEAKSKNPSLKVQLSNIKVAQSNYHMSEKGFYPKIDLVARQDWNKNISGTEGDDDSSSIMLKFVYNLYNGGADAANKQKTISEVNQEAEVYSDLLRRVEESVRLSWMAYTTLEKQMVYIKSHKEMSEKTLKSYIEEFDLGRRTLLDIVDTEEEVYSASRELTNAKYDYIYAQYRILESIDGLLPYFDNTFVNVVGLGEEESSKSNELDMLPEQM